MVYPIILDGFQTSFCWCRISSTAGIQHGVNLFFLGMGNQSKLTGCWTNLGEDICKHPIGMAQISLGQWPWQTNNNKKKQTPAVRSSFSWCNGIDVDRDDSCRPQTFYSSILLSTKASPTLPWRVGRQWIHAVKYGELSSFGEQKLPMFEAKITTLVDSWCLNWLKSSEIILNHRFWWLSHHVKHPDELLRLVSGFHTSPLSKCGTLANGARWERGFSNMEVQKQPEGTLMMIYVRYF